MWQLNGENLQQRDQAHSWDLLREKWSLNSALSTASLPHLTVSTKIIFLFLKFGRGHTYLWLKHKLHSKIKHADASSILLPWLCFAFQAVCSEMELTELLPTEGDLGMATIQQTIR